MTTLAQTLEQRIRNNRLMTVDVAWQDEIIFSSYNDLSLRNATHTVAEALGVPLPNSAPLNDDIFGGEGIPQVERVLLFLMDGMGYKHLNMLAEQDPDIAQAVADLTQGRGSVPITSVMPSTTAVALTSLWTGGAPLATGMIGTIQYSEKYHLLANNLGMKPALGSYPNDVFLEWGLTVDDMVALPGIAEHLQQHGITSALTTYKMYIGTGLSRILHRGITDYYSYSTSNDMPLSIEDALRQTRGKKAYISVYWSGVDSVAHLHGAHNRYTHAEIKTQLQMLQKLLANPDLQDGKTLVMILADHGHYQANNEIDIQDDPTLRDALSTGIYGDNRLVQARVRPAHAAKFEAHIRDKYGDTLALMPLEEAIACGVWGTDGEAPNVRQRLGDYAIVPRLDTMIYDSKLGKLPIISYHAGASDWEMLVPFMWQVI